MRATSDYAAYYPFIKDYDLNREKVPVDYTGQKQTGITASHLGAYDYLGAHIMTTNASGGVNFSFDHVGALVLLRFNVPEAGTALKNVTMSADGVTFTTKGTYDLTANGAFIITPASEGGTSSSLNVEVDYITTVDNEMVTVYFMAAPVDLSGKKVDVAVAYGEGEDVLSFEADGKNLLAGYGHLLTFKEKLDVEIVYDEKSKTVTLIIEESDKDIQKAISKVLDLEANTIIVSGTATEVQLSELIAALDGNTSIDYVSVNNGYIVYTLVGLESWNIARSENSTINLTLGADITFSKEDITIENGIPDSGNWISIIKDDYFHGIIEGNGHTIYNLVVNDINGIGYAGFIEALGTNGKIQNLILENAVIYCDHEFVGGIVGLNNGGEIINCSVINSFVTSKSIDVGGIVGYSNNSISNCTVSGCTIVSSNNNGGGISGYITGSSIFNCVVLNSSISTNERAGGIVGHIAGGSSVLGCVNHGSVTGKNYVGGVVGLINSSDDKVIACANTSEFVSATEKDPIIGGIVGKNIGGSIIGSWSIWNALYACGVNSGTMTECYTYHSEVDIDENSINGMNSAISSLGYQWIWEKWSWPKLKMD